MCWPSRHLQVNLQHGFYKGIPLQYIHRFFSYTFLLCEVSEKFYHLFESVQVWRCPITGDYFTALPDSEQPQWFVIVTNITGDLMWFCMTLLLHVLFLGGGIHSTKHLSAAVSGSWLHQGCLHRAFPRIIRCLRGCVWHRVVVFLAWNLKSLN